MIPIVEPYDSVGNFVLFPNGDRQIPSPANNLVAYSMNQVKTVFFGNVYAEVNIIKGLRYKAVFVWITEASDRGTFNGTNTSVSLDAPPAPVILSRNSNVVVFDNLLYYNFSIKKDHNFNITLAAGAAKPEQTGSVNDVSAELDF
jgi:hypothetical protein